MFNIIRWVLFAFLTTSLSTYASDRSDPEYIKKLSEKYSNRINYSSPFAFQAVKSFDIDCRAADKRYLPLVNILLAKLASLDKKDSHLAISVESRGNNVRIYDLLVQNGKVIHSVLAFEINEWYELRSANGKMEAVLNACFGSYGPIWELPEPFTITPKMNDVNPPVANRCEGYDNNSDNHSKWLENLLKHTEDGPTRYMTAFIYELCQGDLENAESYVSEGYVEIKDAQHIAQKLNINVKFTSPSKEVEEYNKLRNKLLDFGACNACVGGMIEKYRLDPKSRCGRLVEAALEGYSDAMEEIGENPDYCN